MQQRIAVVLFVLGIVMGTGCDSASGPQLDDSSPGSSASPSSATSNTRYDLSGMVTNESGSPVSGANVTVYFRNGDEYRWISVRADGGIYRLTFETDRLLGRIYGQEVDGLAFMHSWVDGYQSGAWLLPAGSPAMVKNIRLARTRRIEAGQSIAVSIDADSPLAYDGDEHLSLSQVWETFEIPVHTAGILRVEARPLAGPMPLLDGRCWPSYVGCTGFARASGAISLGVVPGYTYQISLQIPPGTTGRYDVTTSIH